MKTFVVAVEKVGEFTVRRQEFRDAFRIEAEYSRLTESVPPTNEVVATFARAAATVKVVAAEVPEGWDIDKLDPFDPESYAKVIAVEKAIYEKEQSFRSGRGTDTAAAGADPQ